MNQLPPLNLREFGNAWLKGIPPMLDNTLAESPDVTLDQLYYMLRGAVYPMADVLSLRVLYVGIGRRHDGIYEAVAGIRADGCDSRLTYATSA